MEVKKRKQNRGHRTFQAKRIHYEDMWNNYEKCKEIIRRKWQPVGRRNNADKIQSFKEAVDKAMKRLNDWSQQEFKG